MHVMCVIILNYSCPEGEERHTSCLFWSCFSPTALTSGGLTIFAVFWDTLFVCLRRSPIPAFSFCKTIAPNCPPSEHISMHKYFPHKNKSYPARGRSVAVGRSVGPNGDEGQRKLDAHILSHRCHSARSGPPASHGSRQSCPL